MIDALSLRARLALSAALILSVVALASVLGTIAWTKTSIDSDSQNSATLLSAEFKRLTVRHIERTGAPPSPDVVQRAIQLRWSREPDLVRVSVMSPTGRIVADTDPREIGRLAPALWRTDEATRSLRALVDQAGQTTHVIWIDDARIGTVFGLALQLRESGSDAGTHRAIHSLVAWLSPVFIVLLLLLIGLCSSTASRLLRLSREAIVDTDNDPPQPIGTAHDDDSTNEQPDIPSTMRQTISALERVLERLRALAAR